MLLLARANKGYQVVFIHNRYFIVFWGVNTRDTRLFLTITSILLCFVCIFGKKLFRWLTVYRYGEWSKESILMA